MGWSIYYDMGPESAEMAIARVLDQRPLSYPMEEKRDPCTDYEDAGLSSAGTGKAGKNTICGSIVLGQFLSLLIATMSMSTASLGDRGVNLPSLLNCINYAVLTLLFFVPRVVSRGTMKLSLPIWQYVLYSLVDVEANTLAVLAYRYTTITSVTMLDAFTIPTVMVLSLMFLSAKYNKSHLVGVILCLCGLALTVASDMGTGQGGGGEGYHPYIIKGDVLCIIGAMLYSGANVMQENFVKNHDRGEFLGMAGLCGTVIAGLQTILLERKAIAEVEWTYTIVLFIAAYSLSLSWLYTWTSSFLKGGDAAMFNISLLTSDIYALVFSIFVEHATPNWLYFAAFILIFLGIVLYHSQPIPTKAEGSRDSQLSDDSPVRCRMEDGEGGRWCPSVQPSEGEQPGCLFCKLRRNSGNIDYTTFGDISLFEQSEVGTMPCTPIRESSC